MPGQRALGSGLCIRLGPRSQNLSRRRMVAAPSSGQDDKQLRCRWLPQKPTGTSGFRSSLFFRDLAVEVFLARNRGAQRYASAPLGSLDFSITPRRKDRLWGLEACRGAERQVPRAHWKEPVKSWLVAECLSVITHRAGKLRPQLTLISEKGTLDGP